MKNFFQYVFGDKTIFRLFCLLLFFTFSYIAFTSNEKEFIFFFDYKIDKIIFIHTSIASIFLTILTIFIRIFVRIFIFMNLILVFNRVQIFSHIIQEINRVFAIDLIERFSMATSVEETLHNIEKVSFSSLKEKVSKHILKDEIKEALDLLLDHATVKMKNDIILLQSQYNSVNRSNTIGVISAEETEKSLTEIKKKILNVLELIK